MKDEISESNKIHFAVMALEASSRKMNISPMEMYQRLKRVDLFKRLVLDCYDVMHTQSLKHVSEDLVEALSNWENKTNSTDKFFYICHIANIRNLSGEIRIFVAFFLKKYYE